jgi:hypothetical protein
MGVRDALPNDFLAIEAAIHLATCPALATYSWVNTAFQLQRLLVS